MVGKGIRPVFSLEKVHEREKPQKAAWPAVDVDQRYRIGSFGEEGNVVDSIRVVIVIYLGCEVGDAVDMFLQLYPNAVLFSPARPLP